MIFNDDSQAIRGSKGGQFSQALGCTIGLLLVGAAVAGGCIDSDGMASKEFGSLDPLVMISDGLMALGSIRIAQIAFPVDHDQ
jgi:hypothetical protein